MIYPIVLIDLNFELVLHRDGCIVPHPCIITAILGGAADHALGGVFNSGLTLSTGCPHATIRLMYGKKTPAWPNLGEGVSFESHSRHVRAVFDSCDVASRAMKSFRCARFRQAWAHKFVLR